MTDSTLPIRPLIWPSKAPAERVDYDIRWYQRLNGDSIVTSVWTQILRTCPDPSVLPLPSLTTDDESNNGSIAKIWLSGGAIGEVYLVTNQVTTEAGDVMIETAQLEIRAR